EKRWDLGLLANPSYYLNRIELANPLFHRPAVRKVKADKTDWAMLQLLTEEPTISYSDMSKKLDGEFQLKITLQGVRARYLNLLSRGVLDGYGIEAKKFNGDTSEHVYFLKFRDEETRNQFINASRNFPIVQNVGITPNHQSLIVETICPGSQVVDLSAILEKAGLTQPWLPTLHFTKNSKRFFKPYSYVFEYAWLLYQSFNQVSPRDYPY
ncbi:MAG: Lrp/AsnC family transcriptional regulator, partial [Candidatus Aenigmatarchaeota archaeon]